MTTTAAYEAFLFACVSVSEIEAAKQGGKKCCDMCQYYDAPGFIVNGGQWIPCFQCNPTEKNHAARRSVGSH